MHPSRVFFGFLIAFIIGIALGSFVPVPQSFFMIAIVVTIGFIAVFWRRNWNLVIYAFVVLLFMLGIGRITAVVNTQSILSRLISTDIIASKERYKNELTLYGYVIQEPQTKGETQRVILHVDTADSGDYSAKVDENVLINTGLYPQYSYGQSLQVKGKLLLPQNQPGTSFDYKSYLAKDGIFTVMFRPEIHLAQDTFSTYRKLQVGFYRRILALKYSFKRSIALAIAEPQASFLSALFIGGQDQLSEGIKLDLQRTGTSHFLVVDGYKMMILASVIMSLLLFIVPRQTAFWVASFAILVVVIMAGAGSSVVRAALMSGLVIFAQRQGRLSDARNSVVLAAAVMIFFNPQIVRYDIGFQLSFSATLGLIYLYPILKKIFNKLPEGHSLKELFLINLSLQMLSLPLILYYFKGLSLVSIPANIIITPFIAIAMLLAFFTGLVGLISSALAYGIGQLAWLLGSLMIAIIHFFSTLQWALLDISLPGYVVIIFYFLVLCMLLFGRYKKFLFKI